jgi:hypothetical protein
MVSAEEVEEWAEAHDFTQEDINNFQQIFNVGQVLLKLLSEDELPEDVQTEIDDINNTLRETGTIDGDYDEPYADYARRLEAAQPLEWGDD